jgi:MFS family permease
MGGQKVKNIKLGEYPGITEFPERILIFQQLNYVLPGQKVWKQTRESIVSRFYQRWMIVGISFINLAASFGLILSFSIFFVAILEEFSWSRASIAGAFSVSTLLFGISSGFMGRLIDRFGPRKILIAGVLILCFSTIASGWIKELWHLYALFGVCVAIGRSGLGWVPHSVLLFDCFVEKRGTMVGIAFSGMGIGVLIIGPLSQFLISWYGWRIAYMLLGLMVLVLLLPLNCILPTTPREKDGFKGKYRSNQSTTAHAKIKGVTNGRDEKIYWAFGHAMKTLPFWCFFFTFLLIPLGIFPVMVHQVAYVIDLGYDKILAAFVFGAIGFLSSAGRMLFGALSDRMGREKVATLSFLCSIVGILILLFLPMLQSIFWFYLYAALFGLGFGARGPILTAMVADMYQGKHFGSIYGFINIGIGIGGALGPWLAGYVHDLTGSYRISFVTCIPLLVLACILIWIAGWSNKDKKIGLFE